MAQPMYNKSEIIHVNQDRIANRHDEAGVTGSDANLGVYTDGNWKALWIGQGYAETNYPGTVVQGSTGSVKVLLKGGGTGSVFENISAGTLLPIQCTRIYHNGTNIADGGILGLN
tara:strand:+ start:661 stop:1005 length:345 start_codon:yes stop_codon:yes gene_type:complete